MCASVAPTRRASPTMSPVTARTGSALPGPYGSSRASSSASGHPTRAAGSTRSTASVAGRSPSGAAPTGNGRGSAWNACVEPIPGIRHQAEAAGGGVAATLREVWARRPRGRPPRGSRPAPAPILAARPPRRSPPPRAGSARPRGVPPDSPMSPAPRRRCAPRAGRVRPPHPHRPPPLVGPRRGPATVSSRRRRWTASSSSARRSASTGSSETRRPIASSASAMRPAALIRGAMAYARSRAVGCSGSATERARSARSPARRVAASCRTPAATIVRDSPVMGARSAMVPMAARAARSVGHQPATRKQRRGQAEREAGSGQVLVGIAAVCPVRVDDRRRGRAASDRGGGDP